MAEPIEMLFGMWTWVGPRNYVLDGSPDPHGNGNFEGRRGGPIVKYRDYHPRAAVMWHFCQTTLTTC